MQISETTATSPKILFVDDELPVLKALKRLSRDEQWDVYCANSAKEGLAILEENTIDVVVSDMRMPEMDGAEFLSQVRKLQPETERILITGYSDVYALEKVVNEAKIFNYISKPWDDQVLSSVIQNAVEFQSSQRERKRLEALTRTQNRKLGKLALSLDRSVKEKNIEVEQALSLLQIEHKKAECRTLDLLNAVSNIIELSGKGDGHGHFIANTSISLAKALNVSTRDQENLDVAGKLHNIGSLAMSDYWSYKVVSELDNNELKRYQAQVEIGETILSGMAELNPVAEIIGKHKERLDGSGYPRGLNKNEIPMPARIMGVVTDYVLLFEGRLTNNVSGHNEARAYIESRTGRYYDHQVTSALFDIIDEHSLLSESTILTKDRQHLTPGMILSSDLFSANQVLLLRTGTPLTRAHIEKLTRYENSTGEHLDIQVRNRVN